MTYQKLVLLFVSSVLVSSQNHFGPIGSHVPKIKRDDEEWDELNQQQKNQQEKEEMKIYSHFSSHFNFPLNGSFLTSLSLPMDSSISQSSSDDEESVSDHKAMINSPAATSRESKSRKKPQGLSSLWRFWYDDQGNKNGNEIREKKFTKKNYLNSLKKLSSVSNLPEFFKVWRDIFESLILIPDTNYRFFKEEIMPLWEDSNNIKGGKWIIVFRKRPDHKTTIQLWQSLLISLMIGDIGDEQDICGAVLSIRSWGFMYTVWNKNSQDKNQIEQVSKKLADILNNPKVKYESHKDALKRNREALKKAKEAKQSNDKKTKKKDKKKKKEKQIKEDKKVKIEKEQVINEPNQTLQENMEDGDSQEKLDAGIPSDNETTEASAFPVEAEGNLETIVQSSMDGGDIQESNEIENEQEEAKNEEEEEVKLMDNEKLLVELPKEKNSSNRYCNYIQLATTALITGLAFLAYQSFEVL